MDFELIPRREQDLNRGIALLASGAVMVLLTFVLPHIAWLVVAIYGIYRLYLKEVGEGLVALAIAVVVFFLRAPLGGLLWILGGLISGVGLFYLIRGLLDRSRTP